MLANWMRFLPVFIVIWIARKYGERVRMNETRFVVVFKDLVIVDGKAKEDEEDGFQGGWLG